MTKQIILQPQRKFTTGDLGCFFCLPLTADNLTQASLLNFMQNNASQVHPSIYLQTKHLVNLYDAHFSAYTQVMGQTLVVACVLDYVEPEAVLNPDYQMSDLVKTLADLVQRPLLSPINFQLAKLQLEDAWHDFYDLPANLAAQRFFNHLFQNQPDLRYSIFGPWSKIKALKLAQVQAFFLRLRQAPVLFAGQGMTLPAANEIVAAFRDLNFEQSVQANSFVPGEQALNSAEDKGQFDQAQLLLGYVYNDALPYLTRNLLGEFLAEYLAGDESSVLFQTVREKMGAAYAIQGTNYPALSLLVISTSLMKGKTAAAKQAIQAAVQSLQAGRLDESLFRKCKQALVRRFLTRNDQATALFERQVVNHLFSQQLTSRIFVRTIAQLSPEEFLNFVDQLELTESYCLR